MLAVRNFPFYVGVIIILSFVSVLIGEKLVPVSASPMVWLIMFLPTFACAYEFRWMGGLLFAFLVLVLKFAIKGNDFLDGPHHSDDLIHSSEFGIVLLLFAISVSLLAQRLHNKRKRLQDLVYHDPLTGLDNRMALQQKMEHFMNLNEGAIFACLFIDIDDFKLINDTYGHDAGDACLQEVASLLAERLEDGEHLCARLGGDEFMAVILRAGKEEAESVALNLQAKLLSSPYLQKLRITFSIGIASFPGDAATITEIMQVSDIAMYQAKRDGKNRVRTYSSSSRQALQEDFQIEQDLRRAIQNKEFKLVYQPQIDVLSGRFIGFETLLRWYHPEQGNIPPDKFIPILERTGLIVSLGQWVLQEACYRCIHWKKIGFPDLRISVNVSPVQLQDSLFISTVCDALLDSSLRANDLELEITESISMLDSNAFINKMQKLKAIGVRLAMDDFGSGFSSLNYLTRFPIDVVKLDKEFIQTLQESSRQSILIQTLIELAHRLGLEVVAEGVEQMEQFEFCRAHGCDTVQGFYTGRPITEEGVEVMLRSLINENSYSAIKL